MLMALTRAVSPSLARCELTYAPRQPLDVALACEQHRTYQRLLESLGARVIELPALPDLPDSVFVEDPALVLDELAAILSPGVESRRPEAELLASALEPYRPLARIGLPGTLEGGDVLRLGRKLFVGLSRRSNAEGHRQLAAIVAPHGYEVIPVRVEGCLHLKSAVSRLSGNTLLANRDWFDPAPFCGAKWVRVAPEEPRAANALAVAGTVVFPASFPRTCERIEQAGFRVVSLDISELQKAESGLTCSSLLFES